ncbi:dephospho-CoA kinase [Patescibacteria group bacterium]|nr:dephospho-CoA kinase [Patescibacteria group bacterium]
MLKIGLTGGIGCGKTTVSHLFAQYDIPTIDADVIAHQVVAIGQPALQQIAKVFGEQSLQVDGSLNRTYMRDLVFTQPEQKQRLESIIHPLVYATIKARVAELNTAYCLISIPLLFETQKTSEVNRVLVIDCPVETQVSRVIARDGLTKERINSIIASQVSREFRIQHADDIITNLDHTTILAQQVETLHNFYLSLAF